MSCFFFKKDNSTKNFYKYFPNNSYSFNLKDNIVLYNSYKTAEDIFTFQSKKNKKILFFLENSTNLINDSYTPIIGLNIPLVLLGNACPNFIIDLKNKKLINKLIWSLKYNNKYDGMFIIGDELSVYDSKKYPESQYSTIYLNSRYIISFDTVFIPEKSYKKNSDLVIIKKFNITDSHININSGLIIGTKEYKDYIDQYFFNYLVNRSICKIDIINYNTNNTINNNNADKKLLNNDYFVYSCYGRQFTGQTSMRFPSTNYYKEFPSLVFSSKRIEYNFEFNYNDLFEIVSDRYYLKIIFRKNNNNIHEEWQLGEPFYKKFTFSINPNAKTIGFYIGKEKSKESAVKINETNSNDDNIRYDDIDKKNNNENMNNVIKYIIEILVVIGLILIAYYIGVTVRERRRKRANELKDDNYEYLPEKNKNINEESKDTKKQQFVELNSRLGF